MDPKFLVGLLPIAMGFVNHFKVFAPSPESILDRVNQKKFALTELLVKSHLRLFEHFRSVVNYDDELRPGYSSEKALRGDDHKEEDFFAAYAKEIFRLSTIFSRLETIHRRFQAYSQAQFYLTLFGAFLLFAIFTPDANLNANLFFYAFLATFFLQCGCLIGLRSCESKIQEYEKTT